MPQEKLVKKLVLVLATSLSIIIANKKVILKLDISISKVNIKSKL